MSIHSERISCESRTSCSRGTVLNRTHQNQGSQLGLFIQTDCEGVSIRLLSVVAQLRRHAGDFWRNGTTRLVINAVVGLVYLQDLYVQVFAIDGIYLVGCEL
jgi:hypothetical protein